jgi:hypothetical protein
MGTKIGLTGITFGDATVQNTAATTGVTSLTAGSGISVSGATGAVTVSATGGGTVTSVATGNGLSGGTITTSGTLVLAAPSFNSVGSYAAVVFEAATNPSSGSNYSAGTGGSQLQSLCVNYFYGQQTITNNLSGTWKWMGGPDGNSYQKNGGIAVRVS